MLLPDAILDLIRRFLGAHRAEALSAKNRLKSIVRRDRAEVEAAAAALRADEVVTETVFSEDIPGEGRVKKAHRLFETPPVVEDPEWGVYQLTHGPTADELRSALRIPACDEDDMPTGTFAVIIELHETDRWYYSAFPHMLKTDEGIRKGKYLAVRSTEGNGPGQWRLGGRR